MRISDWSSDVCSSDLSRGVGRATQPGREPSDVAKIVTLRLRGEPAQGHVVHQSLAQRADRANLDKLVHRSTPQLKESRGSASDRRRSIRSEEHTSELQSLMRISYAVFCLKKKKKK